MIWFNLSSLTPENLGNDVGGAQAELLSRTGTGIQVLMAVRGVIAGERSPSPGSLLHHATPAILHLLIRYES